MSEWIKDYKLESRTVWSEQSMPAVSTRCHAHIYVHLHQKKHFGFDVRSNIWLAKLFKVEFEGGSFSG